MKTLFGILLAVLIPTFACAGTVTINFEPSTTETIAYYAVEMDGTILTETCDKTHSQVVKHNVPDGVHTFRIGAVAENSVGSVTAWSNEIQVTVECDLPEMPNAPEIIDGSISCP